MSSLTQRKKYYYSKLSVRTSKQNEDYLRQLMSDNKRSMSYLVDLMIDAFRTRNVTDERDIK